MAFSRLLKVNVTVGAATTMPTSLVSSFDYNGITYTLQTAAPVGYFLDGSPFIVSEGPNRISETSEPSRALNGGVAYGMMKDPFWEQKAGPQGLDEFFADYNEFGGAFETAYDPGVNIDPAVSDAASWGTGEICSFVKAIRSPNKTGPQAQHQTCSRYDVITVVDQAPPLRSVRPGMTGNASTKIIRQVPEVADFTPRGHALPSSFPTLSEIMADVEDNLGLLCPNSVLHRFYRLTQESGTASTGYSAELTPYHSRFVYALNSSAPNDVQREQMLIKTMVHSADCEAMLDFEGTLNANAGQGGCRWIWMMAGACITGDAALATKVRGKGQPDNSRTFWIDASKVGQAVGNQFTTGGVVSNATCQTYFPEMVGMPWSEPDEFTSAYGRYTNTGGKIIAWENLAVASFAQAPAPYADGRELILQGGPENDPSNPWGAGLAFASRQRTWVPSVTWSHTLGRTFRDGWDQMVAEGAIAQWEGPPNQPPTIRESTFLPPSFFSSPISGVARLDILDVEYDNHGAGLTRDMRVSLDGYQWIERSDIPLTAGGTYDFTGLIPSADYWCSWRMVNAHGAGTWSQSHPVWNSFDAGDLHKVTVAGGGSATAPDWSGGTAPKIVRRLYPAWPYDKKVDENPAGAAVGDELFCGVGHVGAAYPAPSYSYDWKRNGSSIGVTTKGYTTQAADAGTTLTCEITATNASGTDVTTTTGVPVS